MMELEFVINLGYWGKKLNRGLNIYFKKIMLNNIIINGRNFLY